MTQQKVRHVPVLFEEVMDFIRVRSGGTYVDCTLGLAGHAEGIARQLGSAGHLIGFDRDPEALELARIRLAKVGEELGSRRHVGSLSTRSVSRRWERSMRGGKRGDEGESKLLIKSFVIKIIDEF